MSGVRHPFTGALYEDAGDGRVRVSLQGKIGLFGRDGKWISGELRDADPHLCGWVGGPRVTSHRMSSVPQSATT